MRRFASGMTGPAGQRAAEIDIEHHAAEIEEQGVGGGAGKERRGHLRRFTKNAGAEQCSHSQGYNPILTPPPAALYAGTSAAAPDHSRSSNIRTPPAAARKTVR